MYRGLLGPARLSGGLLPSR